MSAFEVLTMGRVGVDLYPQQVGVHPEDVETFAKYLGGSATNVAVAATRYQRRTAVITRTGDDPFGRFVHQALRGYGIDDRFTSSVPGLLERLSVALSRPGVDGVLGTADIIEDLLLGVLTTSEA
jgi:5-dehydro-2-deoxygluconokinase